MTPASRYSQGREQTQWKSNLFHIEIGVYYRPWTYLLPSINFKEILQPLALAWHSLLYIKTE